jgi:hypothetical protein
MDGVSSRPSGAGPEAGQGRETVAAGFRFSGNNLPIAAPTPTMRRVTIP